jgi:hypothetical protein
MSSQQHGRTRSGYWPVVADLTAHRDDRFDEAGLLHRAIGFVPYTTKHPNDFRWGLVANGKAAKVSHCSGPG